MKTATWKTPRNSLKTKSPKFVFVGVEIQTDTSDQVMIVTSYDVTPKVF